MLITNITGLRKRYIKHFTVLTLLKVQDDQGKDFVSGFVALDAQLTTEELCLSYLAEISSKCQ